MSRANQRGQGHGGLAETGSETFQNRPREVLRHLNEPFAAAIIYSPRWPTGPS